MITPASSTVQWPRLFVLAICCTFGFYMLFNGHGYPSSMSRSSCAATHNRTLGFGEIFMAVMPHRTDQKDAAALMSHYTDIDITIVDGVDKSLIREKALPAGGYRPDGGQLGCWRAHMNMLQIMVQKKLETALILEADVDWDVRVKKQLTTLSQNIADATPTRPYGYDWKFLWIGMCYHLADKKALGNHRTYTDSTLNSVTEQYDWIQDELKTYGVEGDHLRMLYPANNPKCTSSYAITLEGALTVLYELGYKELKGPIDKEYQRLTWSGKAAGIAVVPPLMAQYRTGSSVDSDINVKTGTFTGNEEGTSGTMIQKSARKTLKEWVYGFYNETDSATE